MSALSMQTNAGVGDMTHGSLGVQKVQVGPLSKGSNRNSKFYQRRYIPKEVYKVFGFTYKM